VQFAEQQTLERLGDIQRVADPLLRALQAQQSKNMQVLSGELMVKASGKIIFTYCDKLTELLLDEVLFETVLVLEEIEQACRLQQQRKLSQRVLIDFVSEVKELAAD